MAPLIELPNGDWIAPDAMKGIRTIIDREHGPRVILDLAGGPGCLVVEFDTAEAARAWAAKFGRECNAAMTLALQA